MEGYLGAIHELAESVRKVSEQARLRAQAEELERLEEHMADAHVDLGAVAEKAGSMLDRVLGPGRSIVRVDATLNFEKIDRERETMHRFLAELTERLQTLDGFMESSDEARVEAIDASRSLHESVTAEVGEMRQVARDAADLDQLRQFVEGRMTTVRASRSKAHSSSFTAQSTSARLM